MNPDLPEADLPKPHPEIMKYLHSPLKVRERSVKPLDQAKTALGITKRNGARKGDWKKRGAEESKDGETQGEESKKEEESKKPKKSALDESDTDEEMEDVKVSDSSRQNPTSSSATKNLGTLGEISVENAAEEYSSKIEAIYESTLIDDPEPEAEKLTVDMFVAMRHLVRESFAGGEVEGKGKGKSTDDVDFKKLRDALAAARKGALEVSAKAGKTSFLSLISSFFSSTFSSVTSMPSPHSTTSESSFLAC